MKTEEHTIETMTVDEYSRKFQEQGVSDKIHHASKCPACHTVQSIASSIARGAERKIAEMDEGMSCIGRRTKTESDARKKRVTDGISTTGCDWTVLGLLNIHELEVVDKNGIHHPRFTVASPEEAQELEKDHQD